MIFRFSFEVGANRLSGESSPPTRKFHLYRAIQFFIKFIMYRVKSKEKGGKRFLKCPRNILLAFTNIITDGSLFNYNA